MEVTIKNLTKDQVKEINSIIRGIAYKKEYTYPTISREDVEMELWINTLELINKTGSVDYPLIATMCYRRIVDMIRKEANRSHFSYESIFETKDNSEESSINYSNRFDDEYSDLILEDILSMFDESSKEYKFVEIMIEFSRAKETNKFNVNAKFNETTVAKLLGFSNSSSSGYKRVRGNVRWVIREKYL